MDELSLLCKRKLVTVKFSLYFTFINTEGNKQSNGTRWDKA